MFKKSYRLRKSFQITNVLKRGRRYEAPFFSLRFWPQREKLSRLAFIASKKIGGAVERHRGLRLLREAAKRKLSLLGENGDLVFIAKPGLSQKKLADIEKEVEEAVKRVS